METMPYRPELDSDAQLFDLPATGIVSSEWRQGLPVLLGEHVALRELRASDAQSLFALLTASEVSRFISPPPTTEEGFERFIAWTIRQRAAGAYVCFAVTLKGFDTAIGIFQVRLSQADTAEWGFAIGSPFWGSGVFEESADLVIEFVFEQTPIRRLEARAAVRNGRGNGALMKIGAVAEATLRRSFVRNGERLDQVLYAILEEDWRRARNAWRLPFRTALVA